MVTNPTRPKAKRSNRSRSAEIVPAIWFVFPFAERKAAAPFDEVRMQMGRTCVPVVPFSNQSLLFGRSHKCQVRFPDGADSLTSGQHAEVRHEQGQYVLYDLQSKHGTYVNGESIDRRPLSLGDVIRLGDAVGIVIHAG